MIWYKNQYIVPDGITKDLKRDAIIEKEWATGTAPQGLYCPGENSRGFTLIATEPEQSDECGGRYIHNIVLHIETGGFYRVTVHEKYNAPGRVTSFRQVEPIEKTITVCEWVDADIIRRESESEAEVNA